MKINYTVHLADSHVVQVAAAKLDVGNSRLWFYDERENLVALFWWRNIKGFTVDGSAEGQQLVWSPLPQSGRLVQQSNEARNTGDA